MFSDRQREALARHTVVDLWWLMVPGESWRSRILPLDQPELESLRRRVMLLAGVCAALLLAVFWYLGRGGSVPDPIEPPNAQSRVGTLEPAAPEPSPRAEQTGEPAPAENFFEDPELALAKKRTQLALFGSAKVSAVYEGHDVHGVRIEKVDPNSFWAMVGVRSGDVVVGHNGVAIDTPAAMVALLNAMEQDAVIRLRVRGADDEERTLYYSPPR